MREADKPVEQPPTEDLQRTVDHIASDTEGDQPADDGREGQSPGTLPKVQGKRFQDYEILKEIARGGMGVVYKARQLSLSRIVALKMIRFGDLASQEQIERFRKEAEAAANLDHPGIVPVYQVGEHEGQHFFSMGFVDGPSLAERLSDGPLAPREAAELARTIAEAVAYAHDQGVIHRDLKPGNVLLMQARSADDRKRRDAADTVADAPVQLSQPRITDFGLAKRVEDDSQLTSTGQVLGTPSYMPPEQAVGKLDDVGPAADVYALGAVLYSLLTGRPPFQAASVVETLRQVVGQDPVAPRRLNRSIPVDLETITLKCLQKSPELRYRTANDVVEDLQRWLDDRPILARPPSVAEQFIKWTRRHPLRAALAVVVFLGLLGTSAGMAWAVVEQRRANSETLRAAEAAERAQIREKTAKNVLDYLIEMFEAAGPEQANGEPMTVVEYLHLGAARIDELDDEPEVQAKLMEAIGSLFVVLTEFEDAEPLLEQAVAYRRAHPGHKNQDLASALHSLATLYQWIDRFEDAKGLENQAIDIWRQDPECKRELAHCLNVLGNVYQRSGDLDTAMQHYQEALDLFESAAPNSSDVALVLHNLGIVHFFSSNFDRAEEMYRQVIDIEAQTLGEHSHNLATTKHVLSIANTFQGKLESALRWQLEAKATREKVLSPEHDHIALSLVSLANIYREMNLLEESEQLLRQGIEIHEKLYEPTHGELLWDKSCLVLTLIELKKFEEAAAELQAQADTIESVGGPTDIADLRLTWALLCSAKGDHEDARRYAQEALSIMEAAGLSGGGLYVDVHMMLAKSEAALGSIKSADVHYRKAVDMIGQMKKQLTYRTLVRKKEYADALFDGGITNKAHDVYVEIKNAYLEIVADPEADGFLKERAARFLLECRDDVIQDDELAHQLALSAVELSPHPSAHYLNTLALAQHATGADELAARTQREAMDRLAEDSFWRESFQAALDALQSDAGN